MNDAMESPVFDRVGRDFFTTICNRKRFQPFDSPAERHGSWEWVFRKRSNDLDRFVLIAFTSLPATVPESHWYEIGVWAGAEKENRYTRKAVSELRASLSETVQHSLRSALEEPLLRAMSMADSFTPRDLDEAHAGPRSEPPKQT